MWPRVVPAGLLCKRVGAKSPSGRGYKSSFQPKRAQSLQDQEKSEAKLRTSIPLQDAVLRSWGARATALASSCALM